MSLQQLPVSGSVMGVKTFMLLNLCSGWPSDPAALVVKGNVCG